MATTVVTNRQAEENLQLEALLTLDEAAKIVRRSHWTIRKYVATGMIRGVRIGRDLLIEPAELRRFIELARE